MSGPASGSTGWVLFGDPVRGRSCGSCTACCFQLPSPLPTAPGHKEANTRCEWQCSKGCRHYERRPRACQFWSCAWLIHENTAELRRPDRSGYIVDPNPDHVLANGEPLSVVQVWIDPARPDAHRAPELRAYLLRLAEEHGMAALIRFNSRDGFTLFAPPLTRDGEWHEARDEAGVISQGEMRRRVVEAGAEPIRLQVTLEEE